MDLRAYDYLHFRKTENQRLLFLQKKSLLSLYNEKVKKLVERLVIVHGYLER